MLAISRRPRRNSREAREEISCYEYDVEHLENVVREATGDMSGFLMGNSGLGKGCGKNEGGKSSRGDKNGNMKGVELLVGGGGLGNTTSRRSRSPRLLTGNAGGSAGEESDNYALMDGGE